LANRYVKIYIRDLKRKVKSLLQISDVSSERSNSQKSQSTTTNTPTIVIQKPIESKTSINSEHYQQASNHVSRYIGRYSSSSAREGTNRKMSDTESSLSSSGLIENALNKYLQLCTVNNSFELDKIVDVSIF
jgi:hypothetical protein